MYPHVNICMNKSDALNVNMKTPHTLEGALHDGDTPRAPGLKKKIDMEVTFN